MTSAALGHDTGRQRSSIASLEFLNSKTVLRWARSDFGTATRAPIGQPCPYLYCGHTGSPRRPPGLRTPSGRVWRHARRDVLREEYSRGRITRAACEAGREFEAVFGSEIRPRIASALPSNTKLDASAKNEQAAFILIAIEKRKRLEQRFVDAIGIADVRFVHEILIKGTGFGKYAAARGDQRERSIGVVAKGAGPLITVVTHVLKDDD